MLDEAEYLVGRMSKELLDDEAPDALQVVEITRNDSVDGDENHPNSTLRTSRLVLCTALLATVFCVATWGLICRGNVIFRSSDTLFAVGGDHREVR